MAYHHDMTAAALCARVYSLGRQAAHRGGDIEQPVFDFTADAEMLEAHFWQGVRDARAEDRINQE
jgi:hypothetical protein